MTSSHNPRATTFNSAIVPIEECLQIVRGALAELIAGEGVNEACALVVALPNRIQLVAFRSVCRGSATFAIPECEWIRVQRWVAAQGGKPMCLVHSHPGAGRAAMLEPSDTDRINMSRTPGIPWVIVGRDGRPSTVGAPNSPVLL
jgi:proteasome lid subunit RPN8/RPN11